MKQHEYKKDGHMTWHLLLEWCNGDAIKDEAAVAIKTKLENYQLSSSTSASQHINNFLTLHQELNNIPMESISENFIQRGMGAQSNGVVIVVREFKRDL
eukprot:3431548-Ditylum_brightwellii.AAC.1